MPDLKKPEDSLMCPLGSHVVRGHNRTCVSGVVTWVDPHVSKNPKNTQSGYLAENLLYLYWNSKIKYQNLPDVYGFKGRNEYDTAILFWLDYWKGQGLPFPSDLDPMMIKCMIALESGFNEKARHKKSTAGGLLQLLDGSIRTLRGLPDTSGWIEIKKEKIYLRYTEKFDPVINIAAAIRFLSYKYTQIRSPADKNAEGTIAGYNQFNPEGRIYAKKVLELYYKSLKEAGKAR